MTTKGDYMSEEVTNQDSVADAQREPVNLTVQDLASLRNIIDISAQRGAFQPKEMLAVGTVYNKLSTFLDEVAKQTTQQG
jgi:hypothetical protein